MFRARNCIATAFAICVSKKNLSPTLPRFFHAIVYLIVKQKWILYIMHPEILRAADVLAADVLASEIPVCEQKKVIADAGHVPTFEKPEAVNVTLLQFLSGDG